MHEVDRFPSMDHKLSVRSASLRVLRGSVLQSCSVMEKCIVKMEALESAGSQQVITVDGAAKLTAS